MLLQPHVANAPPGGFDFRLVWAAAGWYGDDAAGERLRVSSLSTTNLPDDTVLVRAVAAGDSAAFRQLYERHNGLLFSLALKILGDRNDAEDVLQDAFLQVWRIAGSFDDRLGKPLGWLIMLTRSRAIDRLRSRQARARAADAVAEEPVEDAALPGQEASVAESRSLIRQAIHTLPSEQRVLIELAYFGGLTQTEIAAQLGEPLGTVKTRMRTGMLRLREQLGGAS